jgi:uncharacterized protein (TIGR03435 family)
MRYAVIGALLLSIGIRAAAQTGTAPSSEARFDVVSVKRSSPDAVGSVISGPTPGQFTARNVPLNALIRYVYGLREYQLVGGPSWVRSEHFDVVGKYPNDEARKNVQAMVRATLEERFKLKTHIDKREGPIYELVLARSDGKLGPQLHEPRVDCASYLAARRKGEETSFGAGPGEKVAPCLAVQAVDGDDSVITANNRTMGQLATMLSSPAGRKVIDRTGLTREFDFELRWTAALAPNGQSADAVSLFTALQEQLGLKLESGRGPIDVHVIDSAERPMPD